MKSNTQPYDKPENMIYPNSEISIEVKNLKKYFETSYGTVKAVDGISFKVNSGGFFGFLGPNGAGKTTTIRMLIGLLTPTEGTALVNGYAIHEDLPKIKKLIGVSPQEPAVFKQLTGKENIELFGNLHLMPKGAIKKRAEMLLHTFNLAKASKRKVKGYSGGMVRQLNLIIALIHDPMILFLDEPTLGMDPRVRRNAWEFLGDLKQVNKTIFLTTHYIEEAEALCDRVAIIDFGELLDIGPPKELMEKYQSNDLEGVFMEITGRRIMEGM
ncbi:MAG: ATP-binding cassette domain-containing protein [Candidatus Korarchaeota archaeon]|nr:ATP-binding cassette domain-containing protein [Candidatus Korarchaeota archaeon]NIU84063.1 ATP-binding cassette domain-containing protein [Candidatus Thorarchaeota archaeon]NIW12778.1 ATP-binding cassette domain-containing protein [Candidatus Thorarchaeota archaeon]NIW50985.1 ATP-binding cassette domain-containing protein [Candidatus Korarchaeota archaeon]